MKNKRKLYFKLFTSTFYLSAFTFGGGYVIIPLMKRQFVDDLKWLEENEMLDMTAIAQSGPGPVAVNAAILLGYRVGGMPGALAAIMGTILPPFLILSVISLFYDAFRENRIISAFLQAMKPAVTAIICDVVFSMGSGIVEEKEKISVFIMAGAFLSSCILHISTMMIVVVCGCIGLLWTVWKEKKR